MAVGIPEAVRRAVAEVALDPAFAESGRSTAARAATAPPGSRRAAPCRPGRAGRTRSASASSAGSRPSRAGTSTPPPRASISIPNTSTKKRRLSSGFGVSSSAWPMCARSLTGRSPPSTRSRRPSRSYESAPALQLLALDALLLARASSEASSTSSARSALHDRDAVGVEHDARRRGGSSRPPTVTGSPSAPTRPWSRRGPHPARPDRQAHLDQLLDVAHRGVDQHARRRRAPWPAWPAGRPRSATGAGSGIVSTSTSPGSSSAIAACTIRLSSWPQRTVRAGPATREPGTTWIRSTSTRPRRPAAS